MNNLNPLTGLLATALSVSVLDSLVSASAADSPPRVPRFSVDYMDTSVDPGKDFFLYADGTWVRNNPVPPDKSRWGGFGELQERNWYMIHQILEDSAKASPAPNTPLQKVRDFYRSAMDTNRIETLGFKPIEPELKQIARANSVQALFKVLAAFHQFGSGGCFADSVAPDARNSAVYAYYIGQGGLGMPDRDYYLSDSFAKQRDAYTGHIARMFMLLGDKETQARSEAAKVLEIETALARASKPRADLRDPIANYHKVPVAQLQADYPNLPLKSFLTDSALGSVQEIIVRQPAFLLALDGMIKSRPLEDWKVYLRWHLVRGTAPFLHAAAEDEAFTFYGKVLQDQQIQEPRWQRSARTVDAEIGEALGQLFVEKHFPPAARARMIELVANLKAVFHDRLTRVEWMTEATRARALAKFDRFTTKIGHPDKFRDYSAVVVLPGDYFGNIRRAEEFESHRQRARVGQPVDKTEWGMTPPTVNAYFSPNRNEIVFPAGILQPPFFDLEMDDAVNYGGIGVVIGHEITHGYDDQGRKYDAEGNLSDWWTADDAKAFEARAQKVVDQYNGYEALPGLHVNGKLTLGENLADLGGTSIAYEALQRALAKDPSKRKTIDGFTPEQRFFLSFSQVWRITCRDAEVRRRVTVDPHSPGQFRAIGAHVNMQEFFDAFSIKEGSPMWRAPELRAKVW